MTGAAVGRGVAEAHAFQPARIVGGDALTLARHRQFGMTEVSGGGVRAVRHDVAESFAEGDHLRGFGHAVVIAPGEFAVAVGVAALAGFHPDGERMADFDGIEAVVVGEVNHLGDQAGVRVTAVRADRPGGFVLHRLHAQAFVRAILDFHFLLAGYRAGMAGWVVDE